MTSCRSALRIERRNTADVQCCAGSDFPARLSVLLNTTLEKEIRLCLPARIYARRANTALRAVWSEDDFAITSSRRYALSRRACNNLGNACSCIQLFRLQPCIPPMHCCCKGSGSCFSNKPEGIWMVPLRITPLQVPLKFPVKNARLLKVGTSQYQAVVG